MCSLKAANYVNVILLLTSSLFITNKGVGQNVDSLIAETKAKENDSIKLVYLNHYLKDFTEGPKIEDALAFVTNSLPIVQSFDDSNGKIKYYFMVSSFFNNQAMINQADDMAKEGIRIAEELNQKELLAKLYDLYATIYEKKGLSDRSIEYRYKSLSYEIELNNQEGIVKSYTNIGSFYQKQNDLEKAKEYFVKGLELADSLNLISVKATLLYNYGILKYTSNDAKAGEDMIKESLILREELNDISKQAKNYHALSIIEKSKGNEAEHLKLLMKSIDLKKQSNSKESMFYSMIGLSQYYSDKNNFNKALEVLEEIEKEVRDLELKPLISLTYKHKAELYAKKKAGMKAYESLYKHLNLKEELYNEDTKKQQLKSEAKHEFEKQKALINADHESELEKKEIIAKEKQRRQTTYTVIASSGLLMVGLFFLFALNRLKITKNQKAKIAKQKEELDITYERLIDQHQEITDSINYAKRLQDAILPSKKLIKKHLHNNFILFKPKDVVSGDFYFMDVVEDSRSNQNGKKLVYYVAADCTGHGVPGAMVSIVGANGLKRCIQEFNLRTPGEILDKLAQLVAENFSQSEEKIRDGMDLALCCLEMEDNKATKVHYAGANNPLWVLNLNRKVVPSTATVFKEGGGFEIKANKQAIGYTENISPFITHSFEVEAGDTLYTFSDGYPDQFGGENGKKYKSANFRRFLLSIQDEDMEKQKQRIDDEFENWKGELEQVDDVCVIGVRLQ